MSVTNKRCTRATVCTTRFGVLRRHSQGITMVQFMFFVGAVHCVYKEIDPVPCKSAFNGFQ